MRTIKTLAIITPSAMLLSCTPKAHKMNFSALNTLVTVENGMITCINRRWIP
ncbi:MAG: hypothetical protein KBS67_00240 [Bacteroidales bacterium]|nr:hypothetical protein [Candidatus Cryptobacteroides equifaecalis]